MTYKVTYNTGLNETIEAKHATQAEDKIVSIMANNADLNEAELTLQNGSLSIIRKQDGAKHWAHPGFTFGMVLADQVKLYRSIQK